jgi:hypothetical protein
MYSVHNAKEWRITVRLFSEVIRRIPMEFGTCFRIKLCRTSLIFVFAPLLLSVHTPICIYTLIPGHPYY